MFNELKADLFHESVDALCITTNGMVRSGRAVMGLGVADAAAKLRPDLPKVLAHRIFTNGHIVSILAKKEKTYWLSFPVKPSFVFNNGRNVASFVSNRYPLGCWVPGFHAKADLSIIERSAKQLMRMVDIMGWKKVSLPRPGCGGGDLVWDEVKRTLTPIFDERIWVIDKKNSR